MVNLHTAVLFDVIRALTQDSDKAGRICRFGARREPLLKLHPEKLQVVAQFAD